MLPSVRLAVIAMALVTALGSHPASAQHRGAFAGPRGGTAFVGPRGGAFIGPRGNVFIRPGFNRGFVNHGFVGPRFFVGPGFVGYPYGYPYPYYAYPYPYPPYGYYPPY